MMLPKRNLVVIPFHDWRKVAREGTRTRDAHMIASLINHPVVGVVVIVNRPMTLTEMIRRRCSWKTGGEVIAERQLSRLVKINTQAYVVDLFDPLFWKPVTAGRKCFLAAYGRNSYVDDITQYLGLLGVTDFDSISYSVYAAELFRRLPARQKLFDAWDNFLRFPGLRNIRRKLEQAYQTYATSANHWSTNSESSRVFFSTRFGVNNCTVIRSGVDSEPFSRSYPPPADLAPLKRPLIGIGAKITHLLDPDVINQAVTDHPDFSFILVGQLLDRSVLRRIRKQANFHYLGDKPYHAYVAYVANFDVCLIPYVAGDHEHGGDCIKFYEYLAAGKSIVSTRIEGVSDEWDGVFLADTKEEFSQMIDTALQMTSVRRVISEELSWKSKAEQQVNLLNQVGAIC